MAGLNEARLSPNGQDMKDFATATPNVKKVLTRPSEAFIEAGRKVEESSPRCPRPTIEAYMCSTYHNLGSPDTGYLKRCIRNEIN